MVHQEFMQKIQKFSLFFFFISGIGFLISLGPITIFYTYLDVNVVNFNILQEIIFSIITYTGYTLLFGGYFIGFILATIYYILKIRKK